MAKQMNAMAKQESNIPDFDPMIQHYYPQLDQEIFTIESKPTPILEIDNIDVAGCNIDLQMH